MHFCTKSALPGRSLISGLPALRSKRGGRGRLFLGFAPDRNAWRVTRNQTCGGIDSALNPENPRAVSTQPEMFQMMTGHFATSVYGLGFEYKDPSLTEVVQRLGTLRICAVVHHKNSPLRLQRSYRSGAVHILLYCEPLRFSENRSSTLIHKVLMRFVWLSLLAFIKTAMNFHRHLMPFGK